MANAPKLIEKIESHLREHLTPYRCEHVLSVRDQAVSLARQHGINEDQAELAALLHDCLKELSNNELLQYADEHGLEIDEHERKNLSLLHGKVAPYFARSEFGVEDEVVFDAMRKHTTGAVEMGPVKVVQCKIRKSLSKHRAIHPDSFHAYNAMVEKRTGGSPS